MCPPRVKTPIEYIIECAHKFLKDNPDFLKDNPMNKPELGSPEWELELCWRVHDEAAIRVQEAKEELDRRISAWVRAGHRLGLAQAATK
jgi:hypothetical protein